MKVVKNKRQLKIIFLLWFVFELPSLLFLFSVFILNNLPPIGWLSGLNIALNDVLFGIFHPFILTAVFPVVGFILGLTLCFNNNLKNSLKIIVFLISLVLLLPTFTAILITYSLLRM